MPKLEMIFAMLIQIHRTLKMIEKYWDRRGHKWGVVTALSILEKMAVYQEGLNEIN